MLERLLPRIFYFIADNIYCIIYSIVRVQRIIIIITITCMHRIYIYKYYIIVLFRKIKIRFNKLS